MAQHHSRTIVIKLGTTSIIDETTHLPHLSILSSIAETCVKLRRSGHRVLVVSSGAVGVGMGVLGVGRKPECRTEMQALAAVGQCRLMSLWDGMFRELRQNVAQVLVTRTDVVDKSKYLAASKTLNRLLDIGVIPIINENDALSDFTIGGNDILGAITAGMAQAEFLFLMTDVECLYDRNPRLHKSAKAIELVEDVENIEADLSSAGSCLGTGGMASKVLAARLAVSVGVTTIISHSGQPENVCRIIEEAGHNKQCRHPFETAVQREYARDDAGKLHPVAMLGGERKAPTHTCFLSTRNHIPDRYLRLLDGLRGYSLLQ